MILYYSLFSIFNKWYHQRKIMRIKVQEGLPNLLHDHGQLNNRTDDVRRGNLESGP
jgi:hypothetical protein